MHLNSDAFRLFFEDSPQPMWVFDSADGRFLEVNRAACDRYGYTRQEFLGMSLADIRKPEDAEELAEALSRFRKAGRVETPKVWEHRKKNGELMSVEVLSTLAEVDGVKVGFAVLRDVTTERALSNERDRFFELSNDIMVVRAADMRLIRANPAMERILGWSLDDLFRLTPLQLTHPDDLDVLKEAFQRASREGVSTTWEARVHTKQGDYRWIQWSGASDRITGQLYAIGRDITEAHTTKERLAQSEANLSWAQEVSHLGSWSLDVSTMTFTLTDEYFRITGYEPNGYEPIWDNIRACVHPDDRHLIDVDPDEEVPRLPRNFELRIVRPNGEVRHVLSFVDVLRNSDGKIIRWHGTIQDITDRKKSEEALTWSAEIVSSSVDAIIGKSLDGTVQSWNKAAELLYGYTEEEMVGSSLGRVIPNHRADELEDILRQIRRGERIREFETERVDRRGRIFEASVTVSPIQTADGKIVGAASIVRDVSERKESDRMLQTQLMQLGALRKVDQSITGTYDVAATLKIVAGEVLATSDADSVCFYINDRTAGGHLLIACASRDGNPIPEDVLMDAEVMVRNALASPSAESFSPDFGSRCHVLPLVAQGETMGAMAVHFDPVGKRAREQMHFFRTLAGQASIAIEAAWLFEDVQRSNRDLRAAYDETLAGWSRALDLRDHETEGHSQRVTDLAVRLAIKLGLGPSEVANIRRGALLHDIGKLGVPDHILLKKGPLSDEEWALMRMHPQFGYEILKPITFLSAALEIPYCHHEKWDGTGYPRGLRGKEIPVSARIFALADVWDALAFDRPYRKAWSADQIRRYIDAEAGRHFDPSLIAPFFDVLDE